MTTTFLKEIAGLRCGDFSWLYWPLCARGL